MSGMYDDAKMAIKYTNMPFPSITLKIMLGNNMLMVVPITERIIEVIVRMKLNFILSMFG